MRLLVRLLFFPLYILGAGCSTDVCEEAYDKMNACVANLNCNRLDPLEQAECAQAQSTWAKYKDKRSEFLFACANDSQVGDLAQSWADCQLNPNTCKCQ